jgi:cobalt-zinc-cadmium efflux system outer membrane protein
MTKKCLNCLKLKVYTVEKNNLVHFSSLFHFVSLLLCAFFIIILSGCVSQSTSSPQWKPLDTSKLSEPLTLEKCLELAHDNDVQLAQWKARLTAAHAELISAKTIPNPTFGPSWDDIGLKDSEGTNIGNVIYGFSYPIFFWLPREKEIAAAKAHSNAEAEAVLSEQRQLAVEIASAYFGLVADQRKIKLSENLLQVANESMRLVSKQKELQIASDYDIERIKAEQLKSQSDLLNAVNQLRLDQLSFAFALGADRPFYPDVVDCNDDFIRDLSLVTKDLNDVNIPDSIIEAALQASPDWKEKKAALLAAENQLQAEYRKVIPLAETAASAGPKDAAEGWGSAYTIEVPIPLFDWNQGGVSRAKAELAAAQAEEEKARRDAIALVSQAWWKYRSLSAQWTKYISSLNELAQKNERSASRLFEAGQIGYADYLLAQRDSKQAQLDSLDTWQETSSAAWSLSCILGQNDYSSLASNP